MSLSGEDDRVRKPAGHEIGQDLSALSIEEICRRIALLEDEILRLEQARKSKTASKAAADAFFKR